MYVHDASREETRYARFVNIYDTLQPDGRLNSEKSITFGLHGVQRVWKLFI